MKICSREDPDLPHPLQTQLPPDTGSGLRVTWVPVFAVTLAVWVRVPPTAVNGVIAVALQVGVGGGVEDPPPPHPESPINAAAAAR